MPDRLLLRLHSDGSLSWLAQDAGGRTLSAANAGVPPAQALARSAHVAVLVPAEEVVLLAAPAVARNRSQLAKALPFAIEERLASPVEDLHIALPGRVDADTIGVAVVARATLRRWLETLAAEGIEPDVLVPETFALPVPESGATLMLDGTRALLRSDAQQASVCDVASLAAWLAAAAPAALEVFDFRAAPALELPVNVLRYHERQRDPLAFFAAHLPPQPALNLLQGEFAPRHRHLPAMRLWRIAALLAGAALLLGSVHATADWMRNAAESRRLDEAMHDVLQQTFPRLGAVAGDPRQLMQSELARLRGNGDDTGVLHILGQVAPVLGSASRVAVKGIEYHNATLELSLRAPDVETLDLVRQRLSVLAGIRAEVTSTTTSEKAEGGVEGRVRVSAVKS
jgi:general secretion pathway protein L